MLPTHLLTLLTLDQAARRAGAIALCTAIASCGGDRSPSVRSAPAPATTSAPSSVIPDLPLPLVPRPRSVTRRPGSLVIERGTRITVDSNARVVAESLARWLGLSPSAIDAARASERSSGIVLQLTSWSTPARDAAVEPPGSLEEEAFTLDVSPTRAVVQARGLAGLFYGAQALAQLGGARRIGKATPPLSGDRRIEIPCVTIDDAPRLPFRAMHLDVARHFFSKAVVERFIDLMAFYRFNVFHWHLTDDQGFRLEIQAHPELTSIGGRDGFYTRAEARDVVAHAASRFVTVMPELEMPGHARAILASHPELSCTGVKQPVPRTWGVFEDVLCAGNPRTYELIDAIVAEAVTIFPSRLFHVGGDEVPHTRWSACPKCRAAAGTSGIAGLEGRFLKHVTTMLARHGRRAAVWDEALSPALPQDAVILAWQSKERGVEAARRGHDVVMVPHDETYLNTRQSRLKDEPGHEGYLPWTTVQAFDPNSGASDVASKIRGGEGALWTEYVTSPEVLDGMAMPRLAALSEALWSGVPAGGTTSPSDFPLRFGAQLPVLDESDVHYFIEPPGGLRDRQVFVDGKSVSVSAERPPLFPSSVVRWSRDGALTITSPTLDEPIVVRDTTTIDAATFLPSGRSSDRVRSQIVKERLRPALQVRSRTQGAFYNYYEGDFQQLPPFERLLPQAQGRVGAVGLSDVERAVGSRMRRVGFALRFEALFEAPADGVYRVIAQADDGVRIEIDGEPVLVDDGVHAPREVVGETALQRGAHRIRVSYFQGTEGKALDVKVAGPEGLTIRRLETFIDGGATTKNP